MSVIIDRLKLIADVNGDGRVSIQDALTEIDKLQNGNRKSFYNGAAVGATLVVFVFVVAKTIMAIFA